MTILNFFSRWKDNKFKIAAVVVVAIVVLGFAGKKLFSNGDMRLKKVARGDIIQRSTFQGNIAANRTAMINPAYNGYVRKLFAKLGDRVKEGDSLASVSQSRSLSQEEVFPLRSPIAGLVTAILKTEGQYVDSAANILRVDDLSQFFVDVLVPEFDVKNIKVGDIASVLVSSLDIRIPGTVYSVHRAPLDRRDWEKSKVDFQMRILLKNEDNAFDKLSPGLSCVVDMIHAEKKNVLRLPLESVRLLKKRKKTTESGPQTRQGIVMLANKKKLTIDVGIQDDEHIEVLSLKEGQSVKLLSLDELLSDDFLDTDGPDSGDSAGD